MGLKEFFLELSWTDRFLAAFLFFAAVFSLGMTGWSLFVQPRIDEANNPWQGEWKCLELCQFPGEEWTGFCVNPDWDAYFSEWSGSHQVTVKNYYTGEILDVLDWNNCVERVWVERLREGVS